VASNPAVPGTVTSNAASRLVPYTWNASAAWYDPQGAPATFLVLTAPGAPGGSGLTVAQAVATFGQPARSYRYETYVILAWGSATNLLARLSAGQAGQAARAR
jgi:hypothetical protein